MRTCSILTAVLLSMLVIPMIIGSILINGVTYTVLTDATFVANLSPARIQAQVIAAIPALLNNTVMNPDDSETADIYNTLFPDPTVRNIAREQMPALMASMDGDFSPARLTQTLATTVPELMTQVVESASPCTANQERDLITIINTSRDLGDNLCAPQDPATQQQLVSYLSQQVTAALRGDTLTQDTTNPLTTMQTQDMTDAIANITLTARQGIIWPVTLVIIILALAVRSIRGFCGWLGGLSLISGAGGMGIAALSQSLLTIDVASELTQHMPDQSQIITPFLSLIDGAVFPPYVSWLMTAYSVCAGVGVVLVVVALLLTPRRPSTNVVLEPLPGTPPAHSGGNDGSTAPVAVELDTNAIPIGKVTGPLTPEDASATTDAHQFAATSQSSTSELDVTPSASKEPDTSSPSVGGDAQGR